MNCALWYKAIVEARMLLAALVLLLFGFQWLLVWLTSLVELGALAMFLQALPGEFEMLVGMPFAKMATPTGRLALAYVDPVVIFAVVAWGVSRGSDVVSGELGRGTMEMLLAQPVSRIAILFTQATITVAGAALLALACWLGTCQGLAAMDLTGEISARHFIPGAVNLFALAFFLAGISTLVSSWEDHRWRTIGLVGGFYIVSLIVKIVARLAPGYGWMAYGSFLAAFEPHLLIVAPDTAWATSLWYDGTLVGLALSAYALAAIIFCRRDLPAPL